MKTALARGFQRGLTGSRGIRSKVFQIFFGSDFPAAAEKQSCRGPGKAASLAA
ncbi:hypothetical protein OKA05_23195 [Luteolibacter arcticus]|uniref:Uncharacterized protein n=1 Tax=Luteolibacter arcticus TaxID=1581411 RepID=A0ABT3GPM7_9BACT|nr:hypothetical protein [Luteolibacter arcticus]MCW1925483.1 hypothetical protein [Luteolibacter arcticus]